MDDQEALAKVIEALEGLDGDVQRRIIDTVIIFLDIPAKKVMRGE